MSIKRVLVGVAVAAALATGLTGCARPPAAVAVVDGVVIDAQQITAAVPVLTTNLSQTTDFAGADFTQVAVDWRIQSIMFTAAAAKQGVTLSDDLRDQFVAQNYADGSIGQIMWQDPAARVVFAGFIDNYLLGQMINAGQLDSGQLMDAIGAVSVKLNPRYGVWDPDQAVVDATNGQPAGMLADPVVFTRPA